MQNIQAWTFTSAAGALAASGTAGIPFSYTITATNTPTSYNAIGLPAGLSINTTNGVITGTPIAAGVSSVTLSATNAGGTGTAILTLTVNSPPSTGMMKPAIAATINPVNQVPVIESSPTFMPNPAISGQNVTFNVSASDTDGDALTYAWTFGEGGTGSTATPSYVYAAAGTYTVQVTITDAGGLSANSSISVLVNTPNVVNTPGVMNTSDASGTAGASPASALQVFKLQGFANFRASGHDSATLQGILPNVAPLFNPAGASLSINLDGAAVSFMLDRNGRGKSGQNAAALSFKSTKGKPLTGKSEFQGGDVAFSIRLQNGSWASLWKLDPASSAPVSMPMPVTIQLGGITYQATVPVSGTSKTKSGAKFKLAP